MIKFSIYILLRLPVNNLEKNQPLPNYPISIRTLTPACFTTSGSQLAYRYRNFTGQVLLKLVGTKYAVHLDLGLHSSDNTFWLTIFHRVSTTVFRIVFC
jgi:hypothetical protein